MSGFFPSFHKYFLTVYHLWALGTQQWISVFVNLLLLEDGELLKVIPFNRKAFFFLRKGSFGSDKESACNADDPGSIPEDPLEKGMATHSSNLAWRIPWTGEPGGLQSLGSQRVGHD